MKQADMKVGGFYSMRVSGRIVAVRVVRILDKTSFSGRTQKRFEADSLLTGRSVTGTAARLRQEVSQEKAERWALKAKERHVPSGSVRDQVAKAMGMTKVIGSVSGQTYYE